jgi:hypothetical protein
VNASGRNDILESKVARDQENFFVYVKTREKLTSYKDTDWMLLYIDADQDKTTGWEGYDLLINSEVNSKKTILKRYADGAWIQKAELDYSVKGNELMVAIPREEIGGKGFDFHWCDNVPVSGDISDFFTLGDNAPERRSNYRFKE